MRYKKQLEIMGVLNVKTEEQIKAFQSTLNNIILGEQYRYKYLVGKGRHTRYESSYGIDVLEQVLKVQSKGNAANRGGKWGDYIIFSDTKENRESIEFIKAILKAMIECKRE